MKYPQTVKQLNSWVAQHFAVLEGPHRAWIDFPFSVEINGKELVSCHRVSFILLGLKGSQEDCCLEIAKALHNSVYEEAFVDASELLFIRREFEWRPEENTVIGRLAFWRREPNDYLLSSYCWQRDGTLPREVKVQEQL